MRIRQTYFLWLVFLCLLFIILCAGTRSINLSINTEQEHETQSTYPQNGQSQVVGPSEPIVALAGDDVILPCHLEPVADVVSGSVEWGRPDLEPRFVHVWHLGQDLLTNQNPSYQGRTSVSAENLKHRDLSLRLSAVKHSDNGKYRCYFASQTKETTVELVVGSFSAPVISGINLNSSTVVLDCKSKGWYPEPEVLWLDGEGNLLSAGPTETVRGPDDLYTVSSRVTVRRGYNFICRVEQKIINQTSETKIQISEPGQNKSPMYMRQEHETQSTYLQNASDCSTSYCLYSLIVNVVTAFCLACLGCVVFFWRKSVISQQKQSEKMEEEQDAWMTVIAPMVELTRGLRNQRQELRPQLEEVERDMKENRKKVQSVEKKVAESETDSREGHIEEKKSLLNVQRKLEKRKEKLEKLDLNVEKQIQTAEGIMATMTEKVQKVQNSMEVINMQLEDVESQRDTVHLHKE